MIRNYRETDFPALAELWSTAGTAQGYAPQTPEALAGLLTENPYFSPSFALVLEEEGAMAGFACGCAGDDLPQGQARGYFTCLLLDGAHETAENAAALLSALEDAFRRAGKTQMAVSFFNPMRLPWIPAQQLSRRGGGRPPPRLDAGGGVRRAGGGVRHVPGPGPV